MEGTAALQPPNEKPREGEICFRAYPVVSARPLCTNRVDRIQEAGRGGVSNPESCCILLSALLGGK